MKLLFGFILFFAVVIVAAVTEDAGKKPLIVKGKQRRHLADDLKAHHQLMRKTHKNYIPFYPDAPILAPITIGTPAVQYMVSMESGSEAIFVLAKDYPGRNRSAKQPCFDPVQSSTAEFVGNYEGFSGYLEVSGAAYDDVVGLFCCGDLDNTTQRFGVVNDVQDPFWNDPPMPDGVLGLSWNPNDAANPNKNSSAILNLFKEFGDVERYWCLWLEGTIDPQYGREYGVMLDLSSCLEWVCAPPTSDNTLPLLWSESSQSLGFMIDFFAYNDQQFFGAFTKVDTGVPNILLPYTAFIAVYQDVQPDYDFAHDIYSVDCSKAGSLPDWTFSINGKSYTIPSTAYVVDLLLPGNQCALSMSVTDDETTAYYVLGYVFFDFWCVKMDIDNQAISFLDVLPQSSDKPALK